MRRVAAPVVCGAAAMIAVAMVAHTVRLKFLAARRTALTQKLFDVDGPSARDPPRAAWDHAGKVLREREREGEKWREREREREIEREKERKKQREREGERRGRKEMRNAITRAAALL
jgi:hypothetical protein